MGSGHPLSQGGAYPASQHQFNVGALGAPQDNNVALMPVVHSVNRIQHNMIATEYPGECRVSSSPPRWQHGNTHLQLNVQQLESPASKDWDGGIWDNPSQITGVLSSKCRTYFGSPANENSVKQSVYNGGQEGEHHLIFKRSHPLLFSLLTEKPTDLEISMHTSSRSEETNVQVELNTNPLFFDDGHFKSLQVKYSLAAPQCEKTSAQILDDFGVMHSSRSPSGQPSTENVSPVAEMMPPTDEQIVEKIEEQVAHYKRILTQNNGKCGHTCLSKELDCGTNVMDFIFQFGSIIPNSNGAIHLHRTLPSGKDGVAKQNPNYAVNEKSATAAEQALENGSKATKASTKSIPKSENTGDYVASESKKKSTATQVCAAKHTRPSPEIQSVGSAAVDFHTCVKLSSNGNGKSFYSGDCQDDAFIGRSSKCCNKSVDNGQTSPCCSLSTLKGRTTNLENGENIAMMANLTEVMLHHCWSGNTDNIHLFASTEYPSIKRKVAYTCTKTEHPSSLLICSSSRGESKAFGFDIGKNLDDVEQMSASLPLRRMMEAVRLEGVQSMTAVSEETKSRPAAWENIEIESISPIESQEMKMKSTEDQKDFAVGDACFERNLSNTIQIHNVVSLEQPALSERGQVLSVKAVNVPLLEDISDDENATNLTTKLPNTQHEESNTSQLYDPQYENVSEDENPEMLLQRQEAESNFELSSAEKQSSRCVQDPTLTIETLSEDDTVPEKQIPSKRETLDLRHCSDLRLVESDHDIKGLSCLKYDRMRHQEWQTNHSVLKDDTDYQLDDDWMIFPISISDLNGEGEDQHNACPAQDKLQRTAPPLFSPIEEFDTKESFAEAMRLQNVKVLEVAPGSYSPKHERDLEGEEHTPQRKRGSYSDSEDSYDTEDSCNYPCGSERNYMTASTKVLAPLDTKAGDSGSTREGEDEAAGAQNSRTRNINMFAKKFRELINAKHVSKHIQEEKNGQKDVINIDSGTEDEVTPDSGPDWSHGSEKRGALSGAECGSDHEQHYQINISRKESIISISSDSEDDYYQIHTKSKKRKRFSSGSIQGSESPETQPAAENSEQGETSAPRRLSKRQGAHVKDVLQAGSSDQPESTEASKRLIEAPADSKHIPHRTSRPARRRTRRIISESEDSDDSFIATINRLSTDSLSRTATKEPETKKHSPINDTKKQDHYERDSRLQDNPVIPRVIIREFIAATACLKVVQEAPVHMQGSDDAPNKTIDNPRHVNMREKKAFKPKQMQPTKNKAKVANLRLHSKQPSLPSREVPPTSTGNLSSTSRSLSELELSSASSRGLPQSGETSTSSSLLKSRQCRSAVRQRSASSGLPPAHSPSNPPTSDQGRPSTKRSSSSTTKPLPASEIIRKNWEDTYIPIKRDRKSSLNVGEYSRTTRNDLSRETTSEASHVDKVPRRRHKSATPWMKKSKSDAIQCTKARYCDPTRKPSRTVGDNYKWSEKPTVAKATKRFQQVQGAV